MHQELRREDFSYEYSGRGYVLLYKGQCIGGTGVLNSASEGRQGHELVNRKHAEIAIQNILDGKAGRVFREAIDKINEEVESKMIFDLKAIQVQLNGEEPEYDESNDIWTKQIYLGSVMNILPSGKYYTPFACSNVEVCIACCKAHNVPCDEISPCIPPDDYEGAEEYHCEACKDARWYEQAEEELDSIDAYLFPGEGDPTDLFIGIVVESGDE